jgi:hypothetical protein
VIELHETRHRLGRRLAANAKVNDAIHAKRAAGRKHYKGAIDLVHFDTEPLANGSWRGALMVFPGLRFNLLEEVCGRGKCGQVVRSEMRGSI